MEDVRLKRSFCVERAHRIGLCTMYIHIYEAHLQRKVSSGSLSTHCLKPFQCAHQKIHIRSITNASLRFYCHDVCPKLDRKLTYLENKNKWGKRIKRRECSLSLRNSSLQMAKFPMRLLLIFSCNCREELGLAFQLIIISSRPVNEFDDCRRECAPPKILSHYCNER